MLAGTDLDAVSICTPNDSHHDLALAAIGAGAAVLCEKPLAMNATQARDMVDAAQAAGVVNMTGFSKRFFPAARLAKSLIAEGELGEIYALEGHYVQGAWLDPDMPLVWRFQRDRAGSGALGDLGSHLYDLARWWVGEGAAVAAMERTYITERPLLEGKGLGPVDVDDHTAFVVQFHGGAVGTFTASRLAGGIHDDCRLTAHGSRGTVTFTTQEPMKLRACLGTRMVQLYAFADVDVPRHHVGVEEIPTFVHAVRSGTAVEPSFVDGLRCQELLDGVLESAATGRHVTLPG
jgi:predicted dehydrogenase